jgi:hypothetical protein
MIRSLDIPRDRESHHAERTTSSRSSFKRTISLALLSLELIHVIMTTPKQLLRVLLTIRQK